MAGSQQAVPTGPWLIDERRLRPSEDSPSATEQPRGTRLPQGNGSNAEDLARVAEEIVPPTARLVSARDHETGSRVIYLLPSGRQLQITRTKLLAPMPLTVVTLGQPADEYRQLETGSEAVIVRPNGTMLGISLIGPTREHRQSTPEFSSDALFEQVRGMLDESRIDI
jgi:hypothetical protein